MWCPSRTRGQVPGCTSPYHTLYGPRQEKNSARWACWCCCPAANPPSLLREPRVLSASDVCVLIKPRKGRAPAWSLANSFTRYSPNPHRSSGCPKDDKRGLSFRGHGQNIRASIISSVTTFTEQPHHSRFLKHAAKRIGAKSPASL